MEDWITKPLPIHGHVIMDVNGSEIVRDVYRQEDAEQIVREHNAVAFAVRQGENWTLRDWQNWLRWQVSQARVTTNQPEQAG